MHDTADLTTVQKLLVTGHKLEAAGHKPFTAEALTVAAWKAYPDTFGLKGFKESYPCTNSTYTNLMGERSLPRRGWMVKVGAKLYTLSRQGTEEAKRLLSGDTIPELRRRCLGKIQVPKHLETRLVALFVNTAFRRFEEGMKREITYRDAARFWGLADNAVGEQVDATLAKVPATLAAVEQLLIGDSIELSNGQSVNAADLKALGGVHRFLTEQFARNLHQQRQRTFRRIA